MNLNTQPNISRVDDFYEKLITLHSDRSEEESMAINTKLILLLANHIGDAQVIEDAFAIAGGGDSDSGSL
jgi:hypothetical protein